MVMRTKFPVAHDVLHHPKNKEGANNNSKPLINNLLRGKV